MTERDEPDRSLALARQSLRGPLAMKARVRARLAQAPPAGDAPPLRGSRADAARRWVRAGRRLLARRLHLGTVALLVGAGFGAGLWLGRQPLAPSRNELAASLASPRSVGSAPASAAASTGTSLQGAAVARAQDTQVADGSDTSAATRDGAGLDGVAAFRDELEVARAGGARPTAPAANPRPARDLPEPSAGRSRRSSATPTSESALSGARATSTRATSTRATTARSRASAMGRGGAGDHAAALTDDALAAEIALLERVERAIRAGEGSLALALLAELDREIAVAALPEERAAARVLALCVVAGARVSGSLEATEARASAERFLAATPASVYADRIASSCPVDDSITHRRAGIEEAARAGH